MPEIVICAVAKNGSFGFAKGRLCVSGKTKCTICGLAKIVFKKVRWKKNKKHWVGNECRLTRCPVAIWSVCRWSPVNVSKCVSV